MENPTPLRQQIIGMKKGAVLVFSVDEHQIGSIRNYASEIGFRYSRTYKTSLDRQSRTITVKRVF